MSGRDASRSSFAHTMPHAYRTTAHCPIVLLTDNPTGERSALAAYAKTNGIPELFLPKDVKVVEEIPVLGTGKIDYVDLISVAFAT